MKTILFVGEHADFSGLRLGAALGTTLALRGDNILLAGVGKMPTYLQLPVETLPEKISTDALSRALSKQGIERVICIAYLPGCKAAVCAGIPCVYIEPEGLKDGESAKIKKALLAKATQVIVIGAGDKPLDERIYSPNAVRMENPAIWVEHQAQYKPHCFKKENNIVASGPFGKDGGFDVLLKSWAKLSVLHPTWHLTLAGYGRGKSTLQKFINQHQMQHSTELVDADQDFYALLRSADIYVNSTRTGTGKEEVMDAMASKLPVITTDAAATHVNHGVNGLIVPAGKQEPLTLALDELMVNWGKRVELAVEASKQKEKFSFEAFTEKIRV